MNIGEVSDYLKLLKKQLIYMKRKVYLDPIKIAMDIVFMERKKLKL